MSRYNKERVNMVYDSLTELIESFEWLSYKISAIWSVDKSMILALYCWQKIITFYLTQNNNIQFSWNKKKKEKRKEKDRN